MSCSGSAAANSDDYPDQITKPPDQPVVFFVQKSAPENPERLIVWNYAACFLVIFSIISSVPIISTTPSARQTNTFWMKPARM